MNCLPVCFNRAIVNLEKLGRSVLESILSDETFCERLPLWALSGPFVRLFRQCDAVEELVDELLDSPFMRFSTNHADAGLRWGKRGRGIRAMCVHPAIMPPYRSYARWSRKRRQRAEPSMLGKVFFSRSERKCVRPQGTPGITSKVLFFGSSSRK